MAEASRRMRHVYLFCNLRYGLNFLKVLEGSSRCFPNVRHTVVISTSPSCRHAWHRRLMEKWRVWRAAHGVAATCKVRCIDDINAPEFVRSIPASTLGVVAGFNQIFHGPLIDRFWKLVNFHPSVLPQYRGAIASYWVLRNGEKKTGFTLHIITTKIDSGPILHQGCIDIPIGIGEEDLDVLISHSASGYFSEYLRASIEGRRLPLVVLPNPYNIRAGYMPATREK